ncbi:MAG: hypothetical protein EOM34_06820 [Clostridia bacterium]|nr:hypothetical protein [Clostridia bacterium]
MISFNIPIYSENGIKYIKEAVQARHISGDGVFTKKCHEWLKQDTGVRCAYLTTSCTHALEMSAFLTDIQPGDEVIMPSYTFVSTADAFVLAGARYSGSVVKTKI